MRIRFSLITVFTAIIFMSNKASAKDIDVASIEIEIKLHATVQDVWNAWTSSKALETWLAERANVQPKTGGPYELFWHRGE